MTEGKPREKWGSKLAFILAAAGSAVGLGNIWRFPTTVGQNGGAAFVLIYLASVVLVCFSVMLAELAIGRNSQKNPVGAFKKLAPGTAWKYVGVLGVITGWGITSYYSVVAGWTLTYIFKTGLGEFSRATSPNEITRIFTDFASNPVSVISMHAVFIFLTMAVLLGGIKAGIERWSMILMPILLFIMIMLVVRSVTLGGAEKGLTFYLEPDWSKVTGRTIIAAMGQAFFSLSLGMGTMITYGSYLSKRDNLVTSAGWVCSLDTLIALLAGLAIFPALFTVPGLEPTAGAGLIFVVLPNIFNAIPLGNLFGTGFFVLLAIAALTSSISILVVPAAYFEDEKGWSKKKAVIICGIIAFLVGIPSALSIGAVSSLSQLFSIEGRGYGFLDFMNLVFGQYSLMLGSLCVSIFLGWKWGIAKASVEIQEGNHAFGFKPVFAFLIRFLCPAAIVLLLIYLLFINPNAFA